MKYNRFVILTAASCLLTFAVCQQNIDWVRDLEHDTIAVSHGATTRILRGLLAGLDWRAMSSLDEPQGVVFRVQGAEVVKLEP